MEAELKILQGRNLILENEIKIFRRSFDIALLNLRDEEKRSSLLEEKLNTVTKYKLTSNDASPYEYDRAIKILFWGNEEIGNAEKTLNIILMH